MRNITTDFRLGLGSFVDKTLIPFTNEAQVYASFHAEAISFSFVYRAVIDSRFNISGSRDRAMENRFCFNITWHYLKISITF